METALTCAARYLKRDFVDLLLADSRLKMSRELISVSSILFYFELSFLEFYI